VATDTTLRHATRTIPLAEEERPPRRHVQLRRRWAAPGPRGGTTHPRAPRRALSPVWRWFAANTFLPEWLPARLRHPLSGFVVAAALELLSAFCTLGLVLIFPSFSYVGTLELLVVALIALSWGAGPSLAATAFGAILLQWLVLPERTVLTHTHAASVVEIAVLLLVGGVLSLAASRAERVRRRAVHAQAEAQARELAAREASRHMDAFLGIAGHELRSPLTTMLATIQLVARRLELRPQTFDLAALIADVVEEQRLAWPAREITLAATEALPLLADPDRVGQVVTNYLTNALKYSPADQPVRVTLTWEQGAARVAVHDGGPGLPPDEQRRIWQRFHRAEGVHVLDGSGVGLGLGLHISRTIVERHGGEVGVRSTPGKGATFWFTLPASAEQR
jgi:signal transduction histidine kinase